MLPGCCPQFFSFSGIPHLSQEQVPHNHAPKSRKPYISFVTTKGYREAEIKRLRKKNDVASKKENQMDHVRLFHPTSYATRTNGAL